MAPTPSEVRALLAEREWLARLSRRLLGDGPDAEDLTQETLVRALEAQRPISRGWLATVARRLQLERLRSGARRRERERARARPEAVDEAASLERATLQRSVLDEVLRLPDPGRSAVVLRYLEGLSYEEVAERQGVSPVAVRKRVSRAIERLRARLDERWGEREAWTALLLPFAGAPTTPAVQVLIMSAPVKLALSGAALALLLLTLSVLGPGNPAGTAELGGAPASDAGKLADLEEVVDGARRASVSGGGGEETPEVRARAAFPIRPASTVGTLEVRVSWSDGSPAAGVRMGARAWGAEQPHLDPPLRTTDGRGVAVFEQLAPGRVVVRLDRCFGGSAEVEAGRVTVHEVRIPPGVTVRGRVVDPKRRPVRGATVHASAYGNTGGGVPVATADEGTYEVRDLGDGRHVSARAAGYAPSAQVRVTGAAGSVQELDLVLREGGAVVEGIVVDHEEVPLEGARVQIRCATPERWKPPDDGRYRQGRPLPIDLRSDEHGRFRTDQAGAGWTSVLAWAEGRVPAEETVTLRAGGTARLVLRLDEGATLAGVVRRADGTPAAGATVNVTVLGRAGRVLPGGAGPDGAYRLRGLPGGTRRVSVHERNRGEASAEVVLVRGETTVWDATLVENARVAGVVVDERGVPLTDWMVGVSDGRGLWSRQVTTDGEGRFELTDVEEGSAAIEVAPADWIHVGSATIVPLPPEGDVRIVVPDEARHTASVEMRLWTDGEPAPGDISVIVRTEVPYSYHAAYPDGDGRVRVDRLRPGEHRLSVRAEGHAPLERSFHVGEGQSLDLGDLEPSRGGRVRLVVAGEPGRERFQAVLRDEQGQRVGWIDLEDGEGLSGPLEPGPVRVQVLESEVRSEVVEGVVVEGETVVLRAALQPATGRRVAVRARQGQFVPRTSLTVLDGTATPVYRRDDVGRGRSDEEEVSVWIPGLQMGTYRVVAETFDGRRDEAELVVTSLERDSRSAATLVPE